jgi:hypothetical protein
MAEEDKPEALRLGEALLALERWGRKHYRYEIHGGPGVMPGDEGWVRLSAAGRTVTVSHCEMDRGGEDENGDDTTTHYGDVADSIREALRLWHADTTPKRFSVTVYTPGGHHLLPAPERVKYWVHPEQVTVWLVAGTEAEAVETAKALVLPKLEIIPRTSATEKWEADSDMERYVPTNVSATPTF